MKSLFVSAALLCVTSLVHAQLLPVPGARNPAWVLKSTRRPGAGKPDGNGPATTGVIHPDELSQAQGTMPNVDPNSLGPVTPMPGTGRKSILSMRNNRFFYFDDERMLTYYWQSKPGGRAPDSLVTVHDQQANLTYTFRRAKPQPTAAPRPAPRK